MKDLISVKTAVAIETKRVPSLETMFLVAMKALWLLSDQSHQTPSWTKSPADGKRRSLCTALRPLTVRVTSCVCARGGLCFYAWLCVCSMGLCVSVCVYVCVFDEVCVWFSVRVRLDVWICVCYVTGLVRVCVWMWLGVSVDVCVCPPMCALNVSAAATAMAWQ